VKGITAFILYLFYGIYCTSTTGYYSTATGTSYFVKTQLLVLSKDILIPVSAHTTQIDVDNFMKMMELFWTCIPEKPTGTDPYNYNTTSTQRCGTYAKEETATIENISSTINIWITAHQWFLMHFYHPTDGKVNGQDQIISRNSINYLSFLNGR
jgi:hypothetical protein